MTERQEEKAQVRSRHKSLWTPGVIIGALIVMVTLAAGGGLVLAVLEIVAMLLISAVVKLVVRTVRR